MPEFEVRAGASGYSYKPWKGSFYPETLPDADMLRYYAERLPAVEINNTFYRMPKASVLSGWAEKTPAGFRFAIKASRRITHMQRLRDAEDSTAYLFETLGALGDKLGPVLFQLPPYLKKDLALLRDFLATVPRERRATMEFRSRSWFDDDVFQALRDHGVALCIGESGDESKDAPPVATAEWGYLRLRRDDYGDADLAGWADRIRDQGWRDAYVFFKHEDKGVAPKLAQRLMALVAG
ncbi:MAG: DUF72 domain-containing protein [Alphaproteobacteria bacterium]